MPSTRSATFRPAAVSPVSIARTIFIGRDRPVELGLHAGAEHLREVGEG